jgi:hypothetical protein
MRVDKARVCMRVFSTLIPRSNESKSCMRVDESWEARVCMRVFSTLMQLLLRVFSTREFSQSFLMRVFSWEFSQLSLMSRSNENKSCMRVGKREFVWEFSQLSWPCQTRTRFAPPPPILEYCTIRKGYKPRAVPTGGCGQWRTLHEILGGLVPNAREL